jgi:hypothetical protein
MSSTSVLAAARAILAAEVAAARQEAEKVARAAADEAAERARQEAAARVVAAAERQQALLCAERLEAKAAAAEMRAAEQAAIAAEVERLRARTPLEILQDEVAEMKTRLVSAPAPEPLHLRIDGDLDMRFKSSRDEIATLKAEMAVLRAPASPFALREALAEIAALKEQVATLLNGRFIIRNSAPDGWAACALRGANGSAVGQAPTLVPHGPGSPEDGCGATWPFHWTLERV